VEELRQIAIRRREAQEGAAPQTEAAQPFATALGLPAFPRLRLLLRAHQSGRDQPPQAPAALPAALR
jgi:hypothetical protein